jgi:hypothetical protein
MKQSHVILKDAKTTKCGLQLTSRRVANAVDGRHVAKSTCCLCNKKEIDRRYPKTEEVVK